MQSIVYVPVEKLSTHPQNPRLIKDVNFKKLCESIKANPDYFETRPILANKDGIIFAGNMRYLAAKETGMKEVPAAIMDITEDRQKEIMARDNISLGEYNFEVLSNTFGIEELTSWGISKDELDKGFDLGSRDANADGSEKCVRCTELKKYVEGHNRISGHDCMGVVKEIKSE